MKKIINTEQAPSAIGPYVQGVEFSPFIFLSGQIPIDPKTGLLVEGIEAQAKQCLANILAILLEANATPKNIVKTTIFLADLADFDVVNKIYEAFFKDHDANFPARSCVQVARLPKDAKVEIEVIAAR